MTKGDGGGVRGSQLDMQMQSGHSSCLSLSRCQLLELWASMPLKSPLPYQFTYLQWTNVFLDIVQVLVCIAGDGVIAKAIFSSFKH